MSKKALRIVMFAAVAAGVLAVSTVAVADFEKKEATGTVAAVCPEGTWVKLTVADGAEREFGVVKNAQASVKGLAKGDHVKLTYVTCPKSGKDMVLKAEKLHPA